MTDFYAYDTSIDYLGDYPLLGIGLVTTLDPLSSAPIIPGDTTLTAAPAYGANQIPVYNVGGDSWSVIDDFRGTIYYLPPDYQEYTQEDLGPLPVGAVLSIPLSELKIRKKVELEVVSISEIQKDILVGGVTYYGSEYYIEIYDRLQQEDGALATKPTKIPLPDGTVGTATKAQLQLILEVWAVRANESFNNYEIISLAIDAAVDEAALNAIDLTGGWPA